MLDLEILTRQKSRSFTMYIQYVAADAAAQLSEF